MSIGARKIKRSGSDVIHGIIYEVSLVLSGANPGAMIETVITHSDGGDEEKGVIYTGTLIHSADDILEDNDEEPKKEPKGDKEVAETKEKTIGEIIDAMTEEQKNAVYALVGMIVEDFEDVEKQDENGKKQDEEGDDENMKQNVFSRGVNGQEEHIIKHSFNEALKYALDTKASSLKDVLNESSDEETLTHGINSIEMLFPEAAYATNGNQPIIYKDTNTGYQRILDSVTKSPFSRVKTLVADLTEDEARAKG